MSIATLQFLVFESVRKTFLHIFLFCFCMENVYGSNYSVELGQHIVNNEQENT